MRMATIAGRVTLSVRHPAFQGERLLLSLPWNTGTWNGEQKFDPSIVVYDELGADVGQNVGVSEGREAACPFKIPTPVDAYCALLIDETFYKETQP
jgi:microcompartment protein CcmK/EutM